MIVTIFLKKIDFYTSFSFIHINLLKSHESHNIAFNPYFIKITSTFQALIPDDAR